MIPFIDFHTHQTYEGNEVVSVKNLSQNEWQMLKNTEGVSQFSIGLHPWFLTKENFNFDIKKLSQLIENQSVMMIGECGLDRLRGGDLAFQTEAFAAQIQLAESCLKPVVIHCVKAYSELISLKKKLNPRIPMIVHGFNQNEQILKELLKNGFYVSIGAAILKDDSNAAKYLTSIPLDKLFFETDDKRLPIKNVYEQAAKSLEVDLFILKENIYTNFQNILSF
jgi:TatD DNase family protein